MKKNIILLCLALFISVFVNAQWIQEKGKAYLKVDSWWLEANEHYTNSGLIDPNATRGIFITSAYLKYGFAKKQILSFIFLIPVCIKTNKYLNLEEPPKKEKFFLALETSI